MPTRSPAPRRRLLLLPLLVAGAGACALPPAPPPEPGAPVGHVVLVSIDGLRPDAIEAAGATTLAELMEEGAWTLDARTILPSRTLPSHTSMLTGVPPSVHGIEWNDDRVEVEGTVGVPTVFDVADEADVSTAAFFGKAKFRHLIHADAPQWASAPRGLEVVLASRITQDVEQFLRFRRPRLLFVHLSDPDIAGHAAGWMTGPYRWAVRRADAAVGRIVDAARAAYGDDFVLIVTADHGGHGRDHGTDLPEDVTIPWIAWGRGVRAGEVEVPVRTFDTAATALWLLGVPVPADWQGRPVVEAFTRGTATAVAVPMAGDTIVVDTALVAPPSGG